MTDPVATAARAAAETLAASYGPGLAADVEAALYTRDRAQRPDRYLDPVSVASLIVAIATLAWSIYSDQRKKASGAAANVVTRHVRAALRERGDTVTHETDRITEIVVTEIIQVARDPR